jgi:hypothetical protein
MPQFNMAEPSSIYFTMREEPSSTTNSSVFARLSSVQGGRRSVFRNPFAARTPYTRSSSVYSRPVDFDFDFEAQNAPPVPPLQPHHRVNLQNRGPTGTTPRIGNFGGFFARREEEPLPPCPPMPTAVFDAVRGAHSRQVSPLVGTVPSNSSSPSGLSTEWRSPTPVQPIWGGPAPEVLEDSMPVGVSRSRSSDRAPLTATTRMTDETRTEEREQRRRQKKRKRRHHRQPEAWVRPHHRGTGRGRHQNILHQGPSREKNIYVTSIVAGLFLLATVATYVTIALTVKGLGKELHILFSITIVTTVLFLIHALISLRSNLKRLGGSQRVRRDYRSGYRPSKPIRVHMVSDENLTSTHEVVDDPVVAEKVVGVKPPPPAYGLWRSSVVCGS